MKLCNHTPEQQQILLGILQTIGKELIGVTFSDPKDDQQIIRHAAYMRGKFDMAKELLEDDFEVPESSNPTPT